jgi:hypothetical protein
MVPAITHAVPSTVRRLICSIPRKNSQVPSNTHMGPVATMGDTTTTCPMLNAMMTSKMPRVSNSPAMRNGPMHLGSQTACSLLLGSKR